MTLGTSSPALSARGIRAQLGNTLALDGLDIDIAVGRWTSIVGPNGAGKSTLLKVLAGLIAHHGVVHLHGQSMADWPARDRARQLAWLGQSEGAGDDLTVWEVALLGRLPHQVWLSKPNAKDHSAVEQALRQTQAWDWRQRTLGQLSGGERQRVLLARALSVQASVLLMDEPLVNLDPPHQADWLQIVRALVAQGTTVVSVLHEISMALNADNIVVMAKGRITHQGACSDAASHRALEQTFDRRIAIHGVQDQWVALVRSAQL